MQASKESAFHARRMLHLDEVMASTGKSRTTIWRDVRASRFPAPVKVGRNRIAWFEDEIQEWQENLDRLWQAGEEVAT